MAEFRFCKSTASIIAILIFISNPIDAKIDAEIDLAVIWSSSVYPHDLKSMKIELKKLPDVFVVSDTKVQIAIVDAGIEKVDEAVVVPLSGRDFMNRLENWNPTIVTVAFRYDKSFEAVRTLVFQQNGGTRARVVIVLQNDFTGYRPEAKAAAKLLRDADVRLFAVTDTDPPCQHSDPKEVSDAVNWTGDATRCIDASSPSDFFINFMASVKKLQDVILRDLCNWKTACRFSQSNRQECVVDVWQFPLPKIFDDNNAQCNNVEPTSPANIDCGLRVCDDECDRQWPRSPDCSVICGVKSKRVGAAPPKMENCAIEIPCPECPTTTTDLATTPTPETSTIATPTNSTTSTSTTSTSTTSRAQQGVGGRTTASQGKYSIPWLTIGVVTACALGVIAIVVIIVAGKKKKAASKKESAKRSKLAAASSKTQKTPSKVHPPIGKSPSIMSMGKETSFAGAQGGIGAATSVVADLDASAVVDLKSKTALTKKGVKSGSKMVSIKKSVPESKMASIKKSVKLESKATSIKKK